MGIMDWIPPEPIKPSVRTNIEGVLRALELFLSTQLEPRPLYLALYSLTEVETEMFRIDMKESNSGYTPLEIAQVFKNLSWRNANSRGQEANFALDAVLPIDRPMPTGAKLIMTARLTFTVRP